MKDVVEEFEMLLDEHDFLREARPSREVDARQNAWIHKAVKFVTERGRELVEQARQAQHTD